jgi:small multidrug resistance pump
MLPSPQSAALLAIALSFLGVVGDYFLKRASSVPHALTSGWFAIGFVLYSSTAFGWVSVMRHLKLSSIGVLYGTSTVLFLVGAGLLAGERLSRVEILGVLCALMALLLLRRFT